MSEMKMKPTATISIAALRERLAGRDAPVLVDVRREDVFKAAPDMIAGAIRGEPGMVSEWGPDLPLDREVIVYCVHGHNVSASAAAALRGLGRGARALEGGIEAWRAAGLALAAKPK